MLDDKPRLLYIEDCEHLAELFRLVMKVHGYQVDTALNGMDGLAMHRKDPYDLVAVDYILPDILGIEVCNELLAETPDLPVIMLTGHGSEEVAAEAMDIGVSNYVIKGGREVYKRLLPSIVSKLLIRGLEKTARLENDRRGRESERRFRDFTQASSDWWWETGPDMRFTMISGCAFERACGCQDQVIGNLRQELVSPDENLNDEKWRGYFEDIDKRRPFRDLEYQFGCGGRNIWSSVSGVPFFGPSGEFLGYRGTARNISKRIAVEQELLVATKKAKAASKSKSDFLAHMSHELRTPLNSVLGFSHIMREQSFGPLGNEKYLEYTNNIHHSGQHLLAIIDDILDISRIEAGETVLQENLFDPYQVLNSCIKMISVDDGAKHPSIELVSPPLNEKFRGDQRMFKQIVINLLSNAKKFTGPDGMIRIRISPDEENGLTVAVADTGRGIPAGEMSKILEPFGQARSSIVHTHDGAGLGLPLSKMLTELHGGTLELESEVAKGTTVTLHFPPERTLAA